MECFRRLFHHLALIEHEFLSGIRDSRKAGSLWGMMRGEEGVRKSNRPELIDQRVSVRVRVTMLRFLGSSRRDFVGRGQHSSNWVSDISTRTIHQSATLSLSQTIWPRWASRQFLSLHIVVTLLPVTAQTLSLWDNWRDGKRLWQRSLTRSHKMTSTGPSRSWWNGTTSALQPEEITSKGTRVSCVYC